MLDAAFHGLTLVLHWPACGYLVLGVLLGLYFGAVPGLGGLVGLAILLPFTFVMKPAAAFAFLLGMFAVTTTSDVLSAVLLGVPGTATSAATILDGYPMAKRGEAKRAFGAAFTASAIAGVLGALVLGLSIPIIRPLIFAFAQPEYFMLGVLGLTMVGSLAGGNMVKGIFAALIGLLVSMVGYSGNGAVPRYWLGFTYLLDGVPIVPLVLGLFALPELIELAVSNTSISRVPESAASGGIRHGILDVFRHRWLTLRSAAIGIYIGILPGLGGVIAEWIAYGHAVQSARDKSGFGKGDVRGVIAPEAANHSVKGAALIPTVAFGIPGSPGMAILLGAFVIQGFAPGVQMLTTNLAVTYSMMWTVAIANVLGALLLMAWSKQLARATFISGRMVIPSIVLFVFMGAWMSSNTISDWWVLLVFGVVGYCMKRTGVSRPPLILGFVLGPIMENALFVTYQAHGAVAWLARPLCIGLLAIIVIVIVYTAISQTRMHRRGETMRIQESERDDLVLALPFIALVTALFIWAGFEALHWTRGAAEFPIVISFPAVVLGVLALYRDGRRLRAQLAQLGGGLAALRAASPTLAELGPSAVFSIWLLGVVAATVIVGQQVAFPLFIFFYVLFRAQARWYVAVLYAAAGGLALYLMFDLMIGVIWYPSLLFS